MTYYSKGNHKDNPSNKGQPKNMRETCKKSLCILVETSGMLLING